MQEIKESFSRPITLPQQLMTGVLLMRFVFKSKPFSQTAVLSGLLLLLTFFIHAAPGDLDLTFGSGGIVVTDTGSWDYPYAMKIHSDGKIVVVGNSLTIGDTFAAVRYNANGTLDTSFDGDGIAIIHSLPGILEAVAIQSDGKIVVIGRGYDTGSFFPRFTLARLNTDGSLDISFDYDGIVHTQIGTGAAYALAIEIQLDGKIVVGGSSYNGTDSDLTAVRYNTDGSLDSSFGSGGIVLNSAEGYDDRAYALKIQPDGKILLAGQRYFFNTSDFELIRLKSDGTFDNSFGSGGIVTTSIGAEYLDDLQAVNLQPDGKIIAGGVSVIDTRYGFTAVRYNPDGSLDNSFDNDGIVTTQVGNNSVQMYDMAIQQNGKIVLAGWTFIAQGDDFTVVRYRSDGSLDTSFGGDGIVQTSIRSGNDRAHGMGIQPDGKIVVAGWTHNGVNYDYGLVRYMGDPVAPRRSSFDFDGDSKTDISIFRPAVGEWWYSRSSNNQTIALQFGASADRIVPADFTGDGRTDIAVFRPATGFWFVLRSEDNSFYSFPFGMADDVPVVGDFDSDGKADPGVFRPSQAIWYISKSSGGVIIKQFGTLGDVPVPADYDGDGTSDIAIFRADAANGAEWWVERSAAGLFVVQFGLSTDRAVPADYTGDGRTDVAFFRPSDGFWNILRSEDLTYFAFPFGMAGDLPSPSDYDGDGRADAAVFRPSGGSWFIQRSSGGISITNFGTESDIPVPTAFLP